jgi:hypothetical protein
VLYVISTSQEPGDITQLNGFSLDGLEEHKFYLRGMTFG